jgi:AbrB family looped-hinge helix DNA binding protein
MTTRRASPRRTGVGRRAASVPAERGFGGRNVVILHGMTHRVGPKGQVVIPKELRDELGIEPGDEVNFWRHEDHVAVRPVGRAELRGRFRGRQLTATLEAERHADRARER